MKNHRIATAALAGALLSTFAHASLVVTFDELPLDPDSYWNGSDESGGFISQAVTFQNSFNDWGGGFTSWAGFSYSNVDDTNTPGFGNQYAAFTGTAVGGAGNYAVGYYSAYDPTPVIVLPRETLPLGFYVVNTTYAARHMLEGDSFFERDPFGPGDWMTLTIEGFDAFNQSQGTVEVELANFLSPDPGDHFILSDWEWVNLEALGTRVQILSFIVSSNDDFVPTYFAMDHFTVAGPYPPAADQEGTTAIHMDDERFVAWATGWTNYIQGDDLDDAWTDVSRALGPAIGEVSNVVSLGNHGQITMTFDAPIVNGPGFDFAVFGNSFSHTGFLELAYAEVSSDGTNFVRFPNHSLTADPVDFWVDATMDPTLIDGLAGKYKVGYGMPFDLNDLQNVSPLLDVHDVRYVRLVDIVGDGNDTDSYGNPIYDPHPTWGSAGFDLEAIGVLNQWTPLHAWRVEHFGEDAYAPDAANDADWSGDGVPNLLAYALGLDPTTPHSGPLFTLVPEQDETGSRVAFEYTRRIDYPHAHAALNRSLTNSAWSNGPLSVSEEVIEQNGETERVRVRPNGTYTNAASLFFRLEVNEP